MSNPGPGFQRMSGQMIMDVVRSEQQDQESATNLRRREREQRAQSFAQVALAQGTRLQDMTPAQRQYAEAHANALKTRGNHSRAGGFSIDTSGRGGDER